MPAPEVQNQFRVAFGDAGQRFLNGLLGDVSLGGNRGVGLPGVPGDGDGQLGVAACCGQQCRQGLAHTVRDF